MAKMMPVKDEPILQAVTPRAEPQPMVVPEPEAQDGDDIFRAAQTK